jgi:hypothetical protein
LPKFPEEGTKVAKKGENIIRLKVPK